MARRFTKVSEEIEEALEERWIYTLTLRVSVDIHHYSPSLQETFVYYYKELQMIIIIIDINKCNQMQNKYIHHFQ